MLNIAGWHVIKRNPSDRLAFNCFTNVSLLIEVQSSLQKKGSEKEFLGCMGQVAQGRVWVWIHGFKPSKERSPQFFQNLLSFFLSLIWWLFTPIHSVSSFPPKNTILIFFFSSWSPLLKSYSHPCIQSPMHFFFLHKQLHLSLILFLFSPQTSLLCLLGNTKLYGF